MKNTISRIILVALAAAALAPTVAQAQPFSTNYWVTANYLAVLGRNPDPSGWVYWTAWVNANGGPTAQPLLTSALLASAEYCGFFGLSAGCTPNDGQFLTELYQNALGRAPDQAGWTFYLGLLADGVTPAQIVYDFISSAEFTNLYGAYCTAFFPGYATPLAYSTSASAVGGTTTAFTVTYASPSGTNDIVSGQVQFDSAIGCYVEWSGPTSAPTFWLNGTSAGCSLNPGSSIAAVPGNPQSIAVTFMLTFSEQSFVGTHQVTAWGLNAENLETPPQPLGSFVVTQGQDFTFSSLPGGTVTVPEGTYVTVTVTATSVNGFSGSVTPAVSVGPSCAYVWSDFSPGTLTLSAGQSATATVSIYNDYCTTGNNTAFTFQGTGESGTLWHTTPGIIVQGGAANFFVTVGTPSPSPALTSYQSVTYPVTVTSVNGFSGWVTLGVAGMPACATSPTSCVTGAFGSSPVYLSGSNSTATTTLTFSASANAPGGAFPITVTGSASGYNQQAAQFTLSTQVTTVTSTPTAVLNSGQSVQVPITLSANAPPITTCGVLLSGGTLDTNGSITGVTCSGSGSGSLNVTVTASAQAQHGTYVIALNGGAVQFHVAIADNVPGSPSGEYTVTAGQTATFTIDSPGPDDLYTEGTAVPLLNGGYVRWAYVDSVLPNSLTVTLSPPASVQAGGYTLDVNLCGCFFNTSERGGGNGDICEVVAPLEVDAAPAEPTVTITCSPSCTPTQSNPYPSVYVGQYLELAASVSGGSGQTATGYSWYIPGDTAINWSPANDPSQMQKSAGALLPIPAGWLAGPNQSTISFAWTDATVNGQFYSEGAAVSVIVTLSDGSFKEALAQFNVLVPNLTLNPAQMQTGSAITTQCPTVGGALAMCLYSPSSGQPGMTFQYTLQQQGPQGFFNDLYEWVGIVNNAQINWTKTSGTVCPLSTSGLDVKSGATSPNYSTCTAGGNPGYACDSPSVGLSNPPDNQVSANESFSTFLMYQPNPPNNTGGMWVPLWRVDWTWVATAIFPSYPAQGWQFPGGGLSAGSGGDPPTATFLANTSVNGGSQYPSWLQQASTQVPPCNQ